jgi:hypothetical protein
MEVFHTQKRFQSLAVCQALHEQLGLGTTEDDEKNMNRASLQSGATTGHQLQIPPTLSKQDIQKKASQAGKKIAAAQKMKKEDQKLQYMKRKKP